MQKPTISVIVPVYNTEKYLNKCVDSILNQAFKDLELILVDDGSSDSSGKICDEYAARDSRVVVIHKENGGQATARNMALDIARGDYISFIDSDDFIEDKMYETMHSAIEETGASIAMCGRYMVSADYKRKTKSFALDTQCVWEGEEIKRRFLLTNNLGGSPCDKLFSRSLFEQPTRVRFPVGYICEDLPAIFEVLFKAERLVHVGVPFYNYYQRQSSTSRGSFNERAYGLVIYPSQILERVSREYPHLLEEAGFYYAIHIEDLLIKLDPSFSKQECKKYRKELLKYKRVMMKHSTGIRRKLFILFRWNLFYTLRRIKKAFKK